MTNYNYSPKRRKKTIIKIQKVFNAVFTLTHFPEARDK
jgi:hypothetical protein